MGEIAKGNANSDQLAARGNYRAATAQDMGEVYSRILAQQQQIFLSRFAQKTFNENPNAECSPNDLPGFSENVQGAGSTLIQEVR